MTFQKNILTRAILATGLVAGLGFSQTALAETASDTLEITAGLSEAMTVTCGTDLDFGITRVTDTAFTQTTLTLATDNAITKAGDDKVVPLATGTAGVCTLSGSLANDVKPTVTFDGTSTLTGEIFGTLNAAASGQELTVDTFTTNVGERTIDEGGMIILIGANLVIPVNAGLGGYKGTIEVTVNDANGT